MPRMFRTLTLFALLAAFTACAPRDQSDPWAGEWVDLTHDFGTDTLYWPTAAPFELTVDSRGETDDGYWYEAYSFRTAEHGGTHIDAPSHFAEGQPSVDAIPLSRLIGPAFVVDVSEAALANPDYLATPADFEAWESTHGRLPTGAIVLLRTGYGRFWPDPRTLPRHHPKRPGGRRRVAFSGLASRCRTPARGGTRGGPPSASTPQASTTANRVSSSRTASCSRPLFPHSRTWRI